MSTPTSGIIDSGTFDSETTQHNRRLKSTIMATMQASLALLADLRAAQENHPLSILHLAEPILESRQNENENHNQTQTRTQTHNKTENTPATRPSVASSEASSSHPALTPTTLALDLQHYRDLFSKLRFSYLEQVTKEKYLRSIVGDPPLLVAPAENAELEEKLAVMKRELKGKKMECDELVGEMEETARRLAGRYEGVNRGMGELERVPGEIAQLQQEVERVKAELADRRETLGGQSGDEDPRMQMGLDATQAALKERRRENERLDQEIEELKARMPVKMRECERAERELEEIERRRNEVTRQAREVKRIREEGGRDYVGERGKWYRAQETVLRGLLEV